MKSFIAAVLAALAVARSPAASSPVASSLVVRSPVARSPVASSLVVRSPVASSLVARSPVARSPVASSLVLRSLVASSPAASSPVVRSLVASSPVVRSLVARSPVASSPVARSPGDDMEIQVGITAHDFTDHGCRDVIILFAHGSLEAGNLGTVCGPAVAQCLKHLFGADRVAVEGIEYEALLETNHLPGGADPGGVREMKRLIANVTGNCLASRLLVGGYSQGAAITHRAVEGLCQTQKDKVAAAFTFGDTQNEQDHGKINNFPAQKTHIICNDDDANCNGTLALIPAHMDYTVRVPEQVDFLVERLAAVDLHPLCLVMPRHP